MFTYSYVPPRDVKKASAVVIACFAVGIGLVYSASFIHVLPYLFQTIGIAVLAVDIFLTTRYIVRRYAYSIVKVGDGDYDFVVNQIQGKKSTVVCRINADEITDFFKSESKLPEKYRKGDGKRIVRFDYCQNMFGDEAYYIFAEINEGKVGVKFSPDEKLAGIIELLRPKTRENKSSDEKNNA